MPEPPPPGQEMLREYLAHRDEPCPSCGYNLRGLQGTRCPECALEVRLGVQLSDARTGLLISAIVGLMISAAPAGALLLFVGFMSLRFRPPPARDALILCAFPAIVALLLGTCASLLARPRGRRWFRRVPESTARGVAWGAWIASIVAGVVYLVIIFTQVR